MRGRGSARITRFAAAAVLALLPGLARAQLYNLTDLGSLGGANGSGANARNAGLVAGYSFIPGANLIHAMVNDRGTVSDLGTLGGTQSWARGVNSNGDIVGWAYPRGVAWQRPFLWHAGVMTDLGTFGGNIGDAFDINDDGTIVGSAFDTQTRERAFWWRNGVMHDLGTLGGSQSWAYAINEQGDITGKAMLEGDDELHAYLAKPGSPLYDLGTLGGPASYGADVNELVHVCGWSMLQVNSVPSRGFFWANGVMKSLGTLGGVYSSAFGMNDHDDVVGASTRADETQVAFLWRNDQMLDLSTLLPPGTGWLLTLATAIDNDGAIVGVGTRPDGKSRAFLLTPASSTGVPGRAPQLAFAGATPNPARLGARFAFELPVPGRAALVLHDLAGRAVRELATGWYGAGPQSVAWDGRDDAGERLPPGAYFARLATPQGALVRRFVVLR